MRGVAGGPLGDLTQDAHGIGVHATRPRSALRSHPASGPLLHVSPIPAQRSSAPSLSQRAKSFAPPSGVPPDIISRDKRACFADRVPSRQHEDSNMLQKVKPALQLKDMSAVPPAVLHRRSVGGRRRQVHPRGLQPGRRPADRHGAGDGRGRDAARDRSRQCGLARMAREDRQGARGSPAQVVRPHDGEPGGPRGADDRGAGQAARRVARRDRLRRVLHRVVRRGGQARLRRHDPAPRPPTAASS